MPPLASLVWGHKVDKCVLHLVSYYNRELQCFRCPDCGEKTPIRRASTFDAERLVLLIECFTLQHEDCAQYKNFLRARAERTWRRELANFDQQLTSC